MSVDQKISQEVEIFVLPESWFLVAAESDTSNGKLSIANLFRKADSATNVNLDANHTTAADGNIIANVNFLDTTTVAPAEQTFGQLRVVVQDPANASFEGEMFLAVGEGGASTDYIGLNSAGDNQVNILRDLDLNSNDVDNINNLIHDLETSGTDIDFTESDLQEISISANTTFTGVNYAIGKTKTVKITTDGTLRTLAFPPSWIFVGSAAPANQAASKEGILTLTSYTAIESGVIASYLVEP